MDEVLGFTNLALVDTRWPVIWSSDPADWGLHPDFQAWYDRKKAARRNLLCRGIAVGMQLRLKSEGKA